eukprot:scaffold203022_cov17-Tisochrysis_lutea.AAC.1
MPTGEIPDCELLATAPSPPTGLPDVPAATAPCPEANPTLLLLFCLLVARLLNPLKLLLPLRLLLR